MVSKSDKFISLQGDSGIGIFINAVNCDSYKKASNFVLTQTPTEKTVEDFWRMVQQYNVSGIVSLTNDTTQFIPSQINTTIDCGSSISVSLNSFMITQVAIHEITLKCPANETPRNVRIWHVKNWENENSFEMHHHDLLHVRALMMELQLR